MVRSRRPVAKSNLAVRLTTAAVVAPLLLLVLFLGPAWGWYAIVVTACAIAAQELFGMTHPGDRVAQALGIATSIAVSVVVYVRTSDARALVTLLLLVTILGVLVPLWRLGDLSTAALRVMAGVCGPLYVGALLTTIALLRRDFEHGASWVLLTLMLSWLADTGGYFFGRFFGKTKLYERLSPKKTREGFVGSLVGATAGALLGHFWYLKALPVAHAVALGVVVGALGQMGDLVESLLKRSTGIKDSGWIIPGHGGLLDRIDALLIVSPLVYVYATWLVPAGR